VFVTYENIANTLKWPSLIAENGKKSLFYEEEKFGGIYSWKTKKKAKAI
jgi:hypothetical protein